MRRFPSRQTPKPAGNFKVGLQLPPLVTSAPPGTVVLQWVEGFGSGYTGDALDLFPADITEIESTATTTFPDNTGRIDSIPMATALLRGGGVDTAWSVTFEASGNGGTTKADAVSVSGPSLTLAIGRVLVDASPDGYEDIFAAGGTYSVTATSGGQSYGPITWLIDVPA